MPPYILTAKAGAIMGGSKAISVRVAPLTGRKAAGQRRHDMRDRDHIPDYVDKDRIADNSTIIEPPDPTALRAEIAAHRAAAGQQRLRADSRTVIAGVITFGAEAQPLIDALPPAEQDRVYTAVAQRIAEETGHALVGLVVHRDESAPHAHFSLRGYRLDAKGREMPWGRGYEFDKEQGREVLKSWGRDAMSRLQDVAAEVPEVVALGITRGERKVDRMARGDDAAKIVHRSVRQLHRDLPVEIERRQTELAETEQAIVARRGSLQEELDRVLAEIQDQQEKAEKNRRLIEEQEAKREAHRVTEEKAAKRIETYAKREQDAKAEIEVLEAKRAVLEADAKALESKVVDLGQQAVTLETTMAEAQKETRLDLPPAPEPVIYRIVTETGFLGRPTATTDHEAVPAGEMQRYVDQVKAIPRRAAAAIATEQMVRHRISAQLDTQKEKRQQEAARADGLTRVLDAVLDSGIGQSLRQQVPAFDRWAGRREQERGQARGHGQTKGDDLGL